MSVPREGEGWGVQLALGGGDEDGDPLGARDLWRTSGNMLLRMLGNMLSTTAGS